MKLFITGTESFVGKELIQQCEQQRGIELSGVDVTTPSSSHFSQADITSADIADLIPEKADALIHLAALSRDSDCKNNAEKCFHINVMGTLNLMAAAQKKNVKQFIFASSEWVYDRCHAHEMKSETTPISIEHHHSEYALSKLVSENNLRQKFAHGFCNTTILRFGIIYGPRTNNWSAVESLFAQTAHKDTIQVGSLHTGRHFIHVQDVADGILASIGLDGFEIINLQGPSFVTLKNIIDGSKEILGTNPNIIESAPTNISVRSISNQKAKDKMGWSAKTTLIEGLKTLHGIVN